MPSTSQRNFLVRLLSRLSLLAALSLPAFPAAAEDSITREREDVRIGTGDPRSGYDSAAYVTRSRSLADLQGASAGLSDLVARPPLGLPPLPDPPAAALIDLGRRLFFDRRLSANDTLSCGMCHVPEQAFTQQELATPVGINGRSVRRNAPALFNVAYRRVLFHDARETDLAAQIWGPLLAADEMGNHSRAAVIDRLRKDPHYAADFADSFQAGLTERTLGLALAAYQRALLSADAPFDRWFYGGDSSAMSESAKRGFHLFVGNDCAGCHLFNRTSALFTDDDIHRTGTGFQRDARNSTPTTRVQVAPGVMLDIEPFAVAAAVDDGHAEISGRPADRWSYRTPSLRNVALTGPYFHDGSMASLDEVIEFYVSGGGADPDKDPLIRPLDLDSREREDLVSFLRALTGSNVEALAADARLAPIGERDVLTPPSEQAPGQGAIDD